MGVGVGREGMSILDYLDWITPAMSLLQDTKCFSVPESRSVEAIQKLDNAGIRMKNRSFVDGKFVFDVKPSDAKKVRRLLG